MTDRELLEIIANQVGVLTKDMAEVKTKLSKVEGDMATKTEVAGIKTDVVGIKTEVAGIKTEVAGIKTEVAGIKTEVAGIKTDVVGIKTEVSSLKSIVLKIETDHSKKLGVLLDGYKLNSEKLDKIEAEITKHEEIILRRIR